jgi:thiamine kinase
MESVALELGPPIATGATADIHDWRNGQVLKLYHGEIPRSVGPREARITRALHSAGVRVPVVGELVEVNGRLGLPMEKLSGPTLGWRLWHSESAARVGHIAAEVHAAMHALTEQSLQTMRVQFRWVIERGSLSAEMKERVLRAMEMLPDGDRICHGDFHIENIIMTDGGPVVIDCGVAHRGNPLADVAQTCVVMTELRYRGLSDLVGRAVGRFIESYEGRYFELSPGSHEEVMAWKPVVAAVRFSMAHAPTSHEPLLRMIEDGLE